MRTGVEAAASVRKFTETEKSRRKKGKRSSHMNPTTNKVKTQRIICAGLVAVLMSSVAVLATPSFGITQVIVAQALYGDIKADVHRHGWKASLKVKGVSDVVVRNNSAIPGGYTGWHSHPGVSIVSVTQGAVWNYHADDPTCTPTIITAGQGFVEAGEDDVHILRNEGAVEARWTTTAIVPANAPARIDQPAPGNCPF
jgi:hypothetical protein